jgi:hypothetical protein
MCVGIDAHHAATFKRALVPSPIQVEPPWIGIAARAGGKNFLDVDLVTGPAKQLPAGHMAEDGRIGIFYCPNDPRGLGLSVKPEAAMYAGHDEIETL